MMVMGPVHAPVTLIAVSGSACLTAICSEAPLEQLTKITPESARAVPASASTIANPRTHDIGILLNCWLVGMMLRTRLAKTCRGMRSGDYKRIGPLLNTDGQRIPGSG